MPDDILKSLYTFCFVLIGVLVLAAFNPEKVVRTGHKVKKIAFQQPLGHLQFHLYRRDAEAGDAEKLYRLGKGYEQGHVFFSKAEIIDEPDFEKAQSYLLQAAALGHPDAKFWIWKQEGSNERTFPSVLATGSFLAAIRVDRMMFNDPCNPLIDTYTEQLLDQYENRPELFEWYTEDAGEFRHRLLEVMEYHQTLLADCPA